RKFAQGIVEAHDCLDRFSTLLDRDVVLSNDSASCRWGRGRRRCRNESILSVRAHNEEISGDHGRIRNMEVGAISDRFFHAVRQVSEGPDRSLARDRHHGAETFLQDDDIDVFGLKTAKKGLLTAASKSLIIGKKPFSLSPLSTEWRPRRD